MCLFPSYSLAFCRALSLSLSPAGSATALRFCGAIAVRVAACGPSAAQDHRTPVAARGGAAARGPRTDAVLVAAAGLRRGIVMSGDKTCHDSCPGALLR